LRLCGRNSSERIVSRQAAKHAKAKGAKEQMIDANVEVAERGKYFLGYQGLWLQDQSLQKIWDKSRRIGATYAQSYEDTRDAVMGLWDVWFSSADESAAREYILYVEQWVKIFDVVARSLGEVVIDSKNDIKAFVVEFESGKRVNALRSNPRAFRSKGGKVVLDEFAHHDDQEALWAAASPAVTWGFPLRVLSTHNGKACLFYRLLDEERQIIARGEKSDWSIHKTDIFQAVADGLVDKILKRPATDEEKQKFIDRCRRLSRDNFGQEYGCTASDEATAFLTYDLIATCEDTAAGDPAKYAGGPVYVGNDIARRRDLWVAWVDEKIGDVMWTREVSTLKGASFAAQDAELDRIVRSYAVRRICMDQTGMGEKPVEDAKRRYGAHRVEGVLMNALVKQDLAFRVKRNMEDRVMRIPKSAEVRDDFHAVRKVTTAAGNVRFDAERTEQGHSDRMWAKALAEMAGSSPGVEAAETSREAPPARSVGAVRQSLIFGERRPVSMREAIRGFFQ
jgi:phage FluMu gp28-like protein